MKRGRKVYRDCRGPRALLDQLVQHLRWRAPPDLQALLVQQGIWGRKGFKVFRDLRGLKEYKGLWDLRVKLAHRVYRGWLDLRVLQGLRALQERQALRVYKGYRALRVLQERQELQEPQARLAHKAFRE